jgi:16S rRNA (cytosine967-C5)-methyltransferase
MIPSARIAAAIEVLGDIATRRKPAAETLREWGVAHRFAGSGDRAAIAGLVYDALRRQASSAYLMGAFTPRAIMLGMLRRERGYDVERIEALFDGARFAPLPLDESERAALVRGSLLGAPAPVVGDYPEWLDAHFARVFGDARADEAAALASRAPLDLRVNTLKAGCDVVRDELSHLRPEPIRWLPSGLRIALSPDAKSPAIQAEPAFLKGHVEVQDAGSQIAALLTGAKPGEQVVDLCAGAGGKTLALAAMMNNRGTLYATDLDKRRLVPIHDRLQRAGVRNVEVRTPREREDAVSDLGGRADLVVIDAPCTGTGTWRRNPDAKWRIRPGALEIRQNEQREVLDRAVSLVKAGGRLAYITCSLLAEENDDPLRAFLGRQSEFSIVPPRDVAANLGNTDFAEAVLMTDHGLQMTPHRTGTDGFFFSLLRRS